MRIKTDKQSVFIFEKESFPCYTLGALDKKRRGITLESNLSSLFRENLHLGDVLLYAKRSLNINRKGGLNIE